MDGIGPLRRVGEEGAVVVERFAVASRGLFNLGGGCGGRLAGYSGLHDSVGEECKVRAGVHFMSCI